MKSVLDTIKENKIKILIAIILVLLIAVGIILFIDNKNKEYIVEEISETKYYKLHQDDKIGVIDLKGEIIIDAKYDSIEIPNPGKAVFICKEQDSIIVLNDKNEKIFTEYSAISAISLNGIVSSIPYEKSVLKYKQDEKYGLINFEGKVITKPIYDEIESLTNKEGELLVKQNGKCGVINSKGAQIIKIQYDNIIADGFYTNKDKYKLSGYIVSTKTQDGYRYGYINYRLKELLKVEYNEIYRIIETEETKDIYLIVSKNGQFGVVKNKQVIINYGYQDIEYDDNNKLFKLQRNSKYGVSDINGKQILPTEYEDINFEGIYIVAVKDEEELFFDVQGNKIEDLKYKSTIVINNTKYNITIDMEGLYGIATEGDKVLVENKYTYIEYLFGDYFIASKDNGDLGIINSKDSIIVDFKYDVLQKIEDSNVIEAKILAENMTELYSKNMEKVCSMYNSTVYIYEDYIQAYSKDDIKYFDLEGRELLNTEIFKNNKLFAKKENDKWGFTDKYGNIVVDCKYDKVTEFNEYGFAGINVDDKWGVVDASGNIIVDPIYKISNNNSDPEFLGKYYKVYYGYGESYYTNEVNE